MSYITESPSDILENYKAYKEEKANFFAKFENAEITREKARKDFLDKYTKIRENRLAKDANHGTLLTEARDYYFANALKGIYIGALEAGTLTDDALFLAENMVDSYIKENDGYMSIMQKAPNDTYLLAKIRRLVEDAAEEEVENLEKDTKDIEDIDDGTEIEVEAEDEKDSIEVPEDTQITTADIEDIVQALNKAGMEVVKKDDADNFKGEEPETAETKPDLDMGATDDTSTEEAPTTEEQPTEKVESETEVEVKDSEGDEEEVDELEKDIEKADAAPEEAPGSEVEETPSTEGSETEEEEEDNELEEDLEKADENEENKEEEFDDTIDPDAVKVQDDDIEDDDDDDIDYGDEDADDFEDDDDDSDDVDFGDEDETEEGEESSEEAIDVDNDGDPDVGDIEEPEATVNVDPNKTMMDELEKEPEIQKAVELIRSRVADAEEAFIKRNQEDKQQIDDLLSKISQNVATVEKITSEDKDAVETKKSLEESTLLYKRAIDRISSDKTTSIFDKMTRNISESIIKNPEKVKMFIDESTNLPDMRYIVETSKVMYAFLETLNTLQLENVNGPYITKIINTIE